MPRPCLIVLALAGCVADGGDEGLVVRNNLAPDGTSCELSPETDAPFLSRGTIHVRSPNPYLLSPLIESRITAVMGQESARTVSLMGARIDLAIGPITAEDAQGNTTFSCTAPDGANPCFGGAELTALADAAITKFRSLFSAPLPPNNGLTAATFDLIPTQALREIERKAGTLAAGARLRAQVVATATVYGRLGGGEVQSLPFVYPVTVCNDCVVNPGKECSLTPASFVPRPGNPCNLYQDGIVDCCTEGATLVCPAVGTMP